MTIKHYMFFMLSAFLIIACSKDNGGDDPIPDPGTTEPTTKTYKFLAIEAATDPATNLISKAESYTEGSVSPINNGIEVQGWATFFQGGDKIISSAYTSAPEHISYKIENGELVKDKSFFTDLTIYGVGFADKSNAVFVGNARSGFFTKKLYHINTDNMEIIKTVESDFGNIEQDSICGFPTDVAIRGDKLFVSYYNVHARGDLSTPNANEAKIAVFNYPSLEYVKDITDDRVPNLGRYTSQNVLEMAENGDIYTFAPSSLACGYFPTPSTNSGILRIKNGATNFDPDYFIDFEELSGGYKINDMYYVANNKAVVRILQEDETNPDYLWATYAPTIATPFMQLAILDLKTKEFNILNTELSGGGWTSAAYVDGNKLYLGVSNQNYAGIYEIDVEAGTATKGATVDGNYAKAILAIEGE